MCKVISMAIIFATFVASVEIVNGQRTVKNSPLVGKDKREAVVFADHFAAQLGEKKDFVTIVDEFFVSDFLERYLQDEENYPLTLLERQVATQIPHEKLKHYFVVFATFEYLSNVYFASKFYLGPGGKQPLTGETYPSSVAAIFRESGIPGECKSTGRISSAEQLDKIVAAYEKANTEMRAYFETHQVEESSIYRKNFVYLEKSGDLLNPERDSCPNGCFGFSSDTPFILVNIPFYQLTLVRENNHLKIITIAPNPS